MNAFNTRTEGRGRSATFALVVLLYSAVGVLQAQHFRGNSGTKVGVSSGTALIVPGNIVLSDTSSFAANSTLVLSGSSSTEISGISSLASLTVSGGGDVALKNDLTIDGHLSLYGGRLLLGDNDFYMSAGNGLQGTRSATAMIATNGSGMVYREWTGTGANIYPVGDVDGTAEYTPVTLSVQSGTFSNARIGIRVADAKHPQNSSTTDYLTRWWKIAGTGVSNFSYSANATYMSADVVGTESNLVEALWNGSSWQPLGSVNYVHHLIDCAPAGFGDITAGESTAVPVELTAFSGVLKDDVVRLQWRTATELNSSHFDVQRIDRKDWITIASVSASGNSAVPLTYRYDDRLSSADLRADMLQYRLRQVDRDGSVAFSPVVEVQLSHQITDRWELLAPYPHPIHDQLNVRLRTAGEEPLNMSLHDLLGKEVLKVAHVLGTAGMHVVPIPVRELRPGIYLLRVQSADRTQLQRVVKVR